MSNFKISLAACRVNAGLTQQELCEILKISPTTWMYWETGKKEPRFSAVMKLSELSGVPMDYINVPTISA